MSLRNRQIDRHAPSRAKRACLVILSLVQFALQAATWASLVRRRPEHLNGPKWFWFLASFVNYVGPAAYLLGGRKITR
ncbi:hypothetical protein GCM10011490_22240 [Pseudoclavibacter endophyticus]|uniref:Cardiolipin synthase N-terminal domain-containing protein n=1 Tax=Pseudoclavibacter endophyticus TaxID=1778590 RepID=A0A6H9WL71_9MICO|nr:PLDc N-terminal domain-containing protein [Pseudoclavibacter endophyticus]KAB1648262.1 hypothetical protein F8O04_11180 [Pseudoclavibacter endophyticus]GGA71132.1 hypothetical protein GCM10011490_22240 [Pseudoclavibacter endophyticus]